MNPPPLPQPSARTCSNCGAAIDGNLAFCPRCGASLSSAKNNGCLVIAAQVFLGFLSLVFGLGGACAVFLGGISLPGMGSTSGATITELAPFLGGGILALTLAGACVWGIIRLGKKRK